MAIGTERVQVAKYESSGGGGDDNDAGIHQNPTPINPQEDVVEAAGVYLQDASDRDQNVYIARASGRAVWRDTVVTSPVIMGNALQLQGQTLHTSVPTADQYLRWNNTESRWEAQDGPTPGFGNWYDHAQDSDEIGTSGSTWEDAIQLDFPSDLELGDYRVDCALLARGSSSSTQVGLRQTWDGDVICSIVVQATGSAVYIPMMNFHIQEAISGSHTFKVQYNKSGGAGTAYVSHRIAMGLRVA